MQEALDTVCIFKKKAGGPRPAGSPQFYPWIWSSGSLEIANKKHEGLWSHLEIAPKHFLAKSYIFEDFWRPRMKHLNHHIQNSTPIQKMSSSQSCSHRNSVQNAPIESSTALTATLFVKNPKFDPDRKMSSSQSCSHRNSAQNGQIERSTALTATL